MGIGPQFVSPPFAPRRRFFVSVDLGQSNDRSACGVLDRSIVDGGPDPVSFGRLEVVHFDLRHLQRFDLGTPYPRIVSALGDLLDSLALRFPDVDVELVFDRTGVGRAVGDLLWALPQFRSPRVSGSGRVRLVPVSVHGGDNVTTKVDGLGVPKRDLISAAVVLFQAGLLRMAASIPERDALVLELVNFRSRISAGGTDTYGNDPKRAKNDDLVTVVSVAAWGAQRDRRKRGYLPRTGPLPGMPILG